MFVILLEGKCFVLTKRFHNDKDLKWKKYLCNLECETSGQENYVQYSSSVIPFDS
jgi:hypothetical protein